MINDRLSRHVFSSQEKAREQKRKNKVVSGDAMEESGNL